jgi:hypothetical protein
LEGSANTLELIYHKLMDLFTPEYLAELGRQLAAIAAFLGGFSITFFGTLLTIRREGRIIGWALGTAAAAAGLFAVNVITVTMMITSLHPSAPSFVTMSANELVRARWVTTLSLFFGTLSLLSSLSISGWLHSRRLGKATTAIGLLSFITIIWAFSGFPWW